MAVWNHRAGDYARLGTALAQAPWGAVGCSVDTRRAGRRPDAQHDGVVAVRVLLLRDHDRMGNRQLGVLSRWPARQAWIRPLPVYPAEPFSFYAGRRSGSSVADRREAS